MLKGFEAFDVHVVNRVSKVIFGMIEKCNKVVANKVAIFKTRSGSIVGQLRNGEEKILEPPYFSVFFILKILASIQVPPPALATNLRSKLMTIAKFCEAGFCVV